MSSWGTWESQVASDIAAKLESFGFDEPSQYLPALEEACEDDEARAIIKTLCKEDFLKEHARTELEIAKQYTLPDHESLTAARFLETLRNHDCSEYVLEDAQEGEHELEVDYLNKLKAEAAILLTEEQGEAVWKQGEIAKMQKRQKEVEKELKAEESKWQEAQERFFKTLAKVKEQADDPTLPSKYIALQSLSEFRQAHSRYMDQLQNIEEKHLAERDEKEDSTEFVRKYDARIREAEELGRIQQQYGLNIKQSAEAESKLAGVQKQKAALDTIFNRPEMHLGKVGLEEEIRRQEEQSAHYDAALHSFKGDMLTSLSEEVAKLQCNDILKVRYEEELRDGGVHLRNAKFLIKLLGEQLHRVMILRAAAGNEARYFEEISNLLRSVQDCADKYTRSLRLGTKQLRNLNSRAPEDALLNTAKQEPGKDEGELRRYEENFFRQVWTTQHFCIERLEESCANLHALLFEDHETEKLRLTPPELNEARAEVSDLELQLCRGVCDVRRKAQDYNDQILAGKQDIERKVLQTFFTKPERMKEIVFTDISQDKPKDPQPPNIAPVIPPTKSEGKKLETPRNTLFTPRKPETKSTPGSRPRWH